MAPSIPNDASLQDLQELLEKHREPLVAVPNDKAMLWSEQSLSVHAEEKQAGSRHFLCTLFLHVAAGQSSRRIALVQIKTTRKHLAKDAKFMQEVGQALAMNRALGWSLSTGYFKRQGCLKLVNPLDRSEVVLFVDKKNTFFTTIRKRRGMKKVLKTALRTSSDPIEHMLVNNPRFNGRQGKNQSAFDNVKIQLQQQAANYQSQLLVARYQHLDGETFSDVLNGLDSAQLEKETMIDAFAKRLADQKTLTSPSQS